MSIILGPAFGPRNADIMIVGEAWGASEERERKPFVGASGQELTRMLHEVGILRSDCLITNVVNARPPDNNIDAWFYSSKKAAVDAGDLNTRCGKMPKQIIFDGLAALKETIAECRPKLIIALGNTAMWALYGEDGITKWRGSYLDAGAIGFPQIPVVVTYHPANILRNWHWRAIAVHDLRYAKDAFEGKINVPRWRFLIEPELDQALDALAAIKRMLDSGPARISADIETTGGQISCIGLGTSPSDALCIPFLSRTASDGNYWTDATSEATVILALRRILTHPNAQIVWQNGLYDIQYIIDNWHFIPHVGHDTMILQHAAFPGLPKSLDFIASMYCHYRRYWKDDGKEWNPKWTERRGWEYNCLDCCRTWEVVDPLISTINSFDTWPVYKQLMSEYEPILFMMLNGARIDKAARAQMTMELTEAAINLQSWLDYVVWPGFNVKSSAKTGDMQRLFYHEMGIPPVRHRKSGQPTLAKDALDRIVEHVPVLIPLIDRIKAARSIGVFKSTFLDAALDPDGRIRCSYNPAGTETDRFSSSTNAFGRGTNLENIPRPPETGDKAPTPVVRMPNVRGMFVPDTGFLIADFDLDRADAHIVAWEANDDKLKALFRAGVDIHAENAKIIGSSRQLAKSFVHGTNYGGGPKTVAGHCGISVEAARRGQELWFNAHPEIKEWHERVEFELQRTRSITTVWGRRRIFFDRIGPEIRNQALAYLGQSPVAWVINKGLRRVYVELPWCQLLLQNHDSIVVQFPADCIEERIEDIRKRLLVPIPYADPLTIPVGCKWSRDSWGTLA